MATGAMMPYAPPLQPEGVIPNQAVRNYFISQQPDQQTEELRQYKAALARM